MPSDALMSHKLRAGAAHLDIKYQISTNGKLSDDIGHNGKRPASSSARLKDVADSYLRQLHGANTATRVLAAQGLGALPSFLPPSQGADSLRRAVELGVVGSLTTVLLSDDEMVVQEACLMALATLLLTTAPFEDHAAPIRPPHLKQLGDLMVRPEVMAHIGYLLTATANTRVVLAAARVVAIMAPYITQANDIFVLESRIIPSLLAAAAARPEPDAGEHRRSSTGDGTVGVAAVATGAVIPRDAAVCVLALLTLAQTTPDMYMEVCTADFLQAISVLYERCIDPDQTSDVMLPADAAALLLRAALLPPNPRWMQPKMSGGHLKNMERNLEESHVLDCLVSFIAVESGNLRKLGDDLVTAATGNATAVIEKNKSEMDKLQAQMRDQRQQLAEARVAMQVALQKLGAAEAEAARTQRAAEAALERGGGSPERRKARREAEADAVAAKGAVEERRRELDVAEATVEGLQREVAALRRAVAPLRWQNDRMARLRSAMQSWRELFGFKNKSKVKVSRPNLSMLTQVLAFLEAQVKPVPVHEPGTGKNGTSAAMGPSREHVAVVQAKLFEAGLVQALVQLFTVMTGVMSLGEELSALAGDLALHQDISGALEGAATQMRREATGLSAINQRAELRLQQVHAEIARLRKALKLDLPRPEGSPREGSVELGSANGLSRTVRQEDVQQRLEALEMEGKALETALGDSEALVGFLQDRVQEVDAACSALSDSYAAFTKAFPSQVSPSTPATAPASGRDAPATTFPHADDEGEPHNRRLRPASSSILAKDPSQPAGHLPGLLSRALAPVMRGSVMNIPALVRQLLGRVPDGAAAVTWPPLPATPTEAMWSAGGAAALSAGAVVGATAPGSGSRSRSQSVGSAVLAAGRPSSAGALGKQAVRPASARSAGAPPSAERSNSSLVNGNSFRASGGFGIGFGTSGYGGGFGGFGGFPGNGPFPTDDKGRPLRYPKESMYGIIQSTFSPLRSYSAPHNGPRFALLLRERSLARSSTEAGAGGGGGGTHNRGTSMPRTSAVLAAGNSITTPGMVSELFGPVSMPLADESRRVVHQIVSSVLFDPIDATILGPGIVRASAASLTLADGLSSRRLTAHGSRAITGHGTPPAEVSQVEVPAAESAPDGDMSVLDALLMQSELLCGVMTAMTTLQQFSKSTMRTCRRLPSFLSFAPLQPGALGPYMARLHSMWATAIARHPEMRVQIAETVAEIAQLALVPGADFEAVYRNTGMLEMLVQMLGSGLRPAKGISKDAKDKVRVAMEEAFKSSATGLKSRYVGRLTATAPPTLRVGPAQQAEQAAAGQALRAISQAQSEVLVSIAQDKKLLTRFSTLLLDHSMTWSARQAAADLLSDLVLGGGPGAEAAVASGAYAGLVEMVNRDMFPFLNQDPRGSKETMISALACLVAHPELLEGVIAAAKSNHGPSAGLPLSSAPQVMTAILRSLWQVVWQVYTTYSSHRAGKGRYVDPELVSALTSTAATAARELAVLADTVPDARRAMTNDLGLKVKISTQFLQAIKNPPLYEALIELRKNLS